MKSRYSLTIYRRNASIKSLLAVLLALTIVLGLAQYSVNGIYAQTLGAPGLNIHNLYLYWIGVVDNGEGTDWPHGPLGNLHIEVFDSDGVLTQHVILRGPTENEFDDGDEMYYEDGIFLATMYNFQPIRIRIWESDPGPGRGHDVLFDQWISSTYATYHSRDDAPYDAIKRARARGGNSWARKVWEGGLRSGIPKIFIKVGI